MSVLGVVGSRSMLDRDYVFSVLDGYMEGVRATCGVVDTICSGGAPGVDTLAEEYATRRGLKLIVHYPNWLKNGQGAAMVRNHDIVKWSDFVIAIWDGKSGGTKHSISLCKKYGKPHIVEVYESTSKRGTLPMLNSSYYNPGNPK